MQLKFEYRVVPELPRLAWVLAWQEASAVIEVTHGLGVETRPGFFLEGAWRGDFEEAGFAASDLMLGSGASITEGRLTVVTPTHPLERLQSVVAAGRLIISNSLPLLLSFTELEPDPSYPYYDIDLLAFLDGLPSSVRSIPTKQGTEVALHYCVNMAVDSDLTIAELPKAPFDDGFDGYEEYLEFLLQISSDLMANASAPGRSHRYKPLATVSSGYDSPACAVLAKSVGCTKAITFGAARSNFSHGEDSGRRIGERLGLEVSEFDRAAYLQREDHPEAEFLAVGTGGEDVVMAAVEEALAGRILFTGFLGDSVWGLKGSTDASTRYRRADPSGASLQEFRLRVGFIHFPVPQSHQRLHPDLHAISTSDQMAPWRRGGAYDRPIPRRIAEDAGIPGEWFGITKKAITQPFNQEEGLEDILSSESLRSFRVYCRARRLPPERHHSVLTARFPVRQAISLAWRASWRWKGRRRVLWRLIRFLDSSARPFTFHWALDLLRSRYRDALPGLFPRD